MSIIINIRGTHGSGKSTIIRDLLDEFHAVPESLDKRGKPNNYFMLMYGKPVYVIGSYANACGGCDGIQPYSEIWPRVVHCAALGNVLFEGALISSSYGNIGRASEEYGSRFLFAFLDTPLETCLERIRRRRAAKGNVKPLDPKNTKVKYDGILKSILKIRDEFKRRTLTLNHRFPKSTIRGLILAEG